MQKHISFTFLISAVWISIIAATAAFGQSPFERKTAPDPRFAPLEHGSRSPLGVPDTASRRPFDVLSYKLLLDWRGPFATKTHFFKGWNEMSIAVQSNTDTILLDAAEMRIDSMWINGQLSSSAPQPDANQHLSIPLAVSLRDFLIPVTLKFAYTRTDSSDDGFYFYTKGTLDQSGGQIDTVEEDLAYTMSEPLDAHKWMPCMDLPYQKSTSQISIIVPAGVSAQSNGLLQSVTPNSDGSSTYNWKSDEPIATYLMVANASKWVQWTDYYHRISNPLDSVPVTYFAWPADYNGQSRYNAKLALQKTPLMLKAFSERFGEYPFKQYAQVPVEPFGYGGMEHQTITTIARGWLNNQAETGIAHELMHQWFGDKTTCETWADIWLNEGFATYGEGIWQEAQYGNAAYDNAMAWFARGYFIDGGNNIAIYNPPIYNVFNYTTVYCKPGCVLYMLRKVVNNDTLFFNAFREYSNQFAYTTANTAQWVDFMSRRLGMDLTDYADQWLYNPGHPIYDIQWGQKPGNALEILVNQTQPFQMQPLRDHYTMPMSFIIYHGNLADTVSLADNARSQTFTLSLPYTADSVQFDSSSVVISLHTLRNNPALSVSHLSASSNASLKLQLQLDVAAIECHFIPLTENGSIQLYDALGIKHYEANLLPGTSHFRLPTKDLASSAYFVRLRTAAASTVQRIGVIR
jgi:aminopeptidase N